MGGGGLRGPEGGGWGRGPDRCACCRGRTLGIEPARTRARWVTWDAVRRGQPRASLDRRCKLVIVIVIVFAGVGGLVLLVPAAIAFTRAAANGVLLYYAFQLYAQLADGATTMM